METQVSIETTGDHHINGTLRYRDERPNRVVVFVHGLTGHSNELIHWLGADFFNRNGYAALRFDLYSGLEGARRFEETSVSDHAEDLNRILQYCFDEGFETVYLVGHSLGGPVVLLSDTSKVSAISLWDPTYDTRLLVESSSNYDERVKGRFIGWGIRQIWGTRMPEELLNFPDCGELISKVTQPIQIISAENGEKDANPLRYYDRANEPKAKATIPGSSHCFVEEGVPEKLFQKTLEWFSQF